MARKDGSTPGKSEGATREDRLKAALKANLQRRKAQARARKPAAPEQSPKGPEQREAD